MTYTPTFREIILAQRVEDGDFEALVELWPIWFGEPLDQSRPVDDIAKDLKEKSEELTGQMKKKAEQQDAVVSSIESATEVIRLIVDELKKKNSKTEGRSRWS